MAPKVIHYSPSGFHSNFARSDPGSQQLLTSHWHWNPPILNQFCAHSTPISPCCLPSRSTFLLFFSILPPSVWSPFCLLLIDPPSSLLPLSLRHDLPKQMQGRSLTALSLMLSTDSGIVPRDVWHLSTPSIWNREERLYGCNRVKENATTRHVMDVVLERGDNWKCFSSNEFEERLFKLKKQTNKKAFEVLSTSFLGRPLKRLPGSLLWQYHDNSNTGGTFKVLDKWAKQNE